MPNKKVKMNSLIHRCFTTFLLNLIVLLSLPIGSQAETQNTSKTNIPLKVKIVFDTAEGHTIPDDYVRNISLWKYDCSDFVDEVILKKENNWEYTFQIPEDEFLGYADYRIADTNNITDGSESEHLIITTGTGTIENPLTFTVAPVKILINWHTTSEIDTPDEASFSIRYDSNFVERVDLSKSTSWESTFWLPSENIYGFYFTESSPFSFDNSNSIVPNGTGSLSDPWIFNLYPAKVKIDWDNAAEISHPDSHAIQLVKGDTTIGIATLSTANNWQHIFWVPDADFSDYSVQESIHIDGSIWSDVSVNGDGSISNPWSFTLAPLRFQKQWNITDGEILPDSIQIKVVKGDVIEYVNLLKSENWQYIRWVPATDIEDYQIVEIVPEIHEKSQASVSGLRDLSLYTGSTILLYTQMRWVNMDNLEPPSSVFIYLYKGNEYINTITLYKDSDWKGNFSIPASENVRDYRIILGSGYSSYSTNVTVTGTATEEDPWVITGTPLKVIKKWNRANTEDFPDHVNVLLKYGEVYVASAGLNEQNNWEHIFWVSAPDFNQYSVEEDNLYNPTQIGIGTLSDPLILTNSTKRVKISVNFNNPDNLSLPDGIWMFLCKKSNWHCTSGIALSSPNWSGYIFTDDLVLDNLDDISFISEIPQIPPDSFHNYISFGDSPVSGTGTDDNPFVLELSPFYVEKHWETPNEIEIPDNIQLSIINTQTSQNSFSISKNKDWKQFIWVPELNFVNYSIVENDNDNLWTYNTTQKGSGRKSDPVIITNTFVPSKKIYVKLVCDDSYGVTPPYSQFFYLKKDDETIGNKSLRNNILDYFIIPGNEFTQVNDYKIYDGSSPITTVGKGTEEDPLIINFIPMKIIKKWIVPKGIDIPTLSSYIVVNDSQSTFIRTKVLTYDSDKPSEEFYFWVSEPDFKNYWIREYSSTYFNQSVKGSGSMNDPAIVTNTYIPHDYFWVKSIWDSSNDIYQSDVDLSVSLALYKGDNSIAFTTLTKSNNWLNYFAINEENLGDFRNFHIIDSFGEVETTGTGTKDDPWIIKNTALNIKKEWEDNINYSVPDSIIVSILKDNQEKGYITLDQQKNWQSTWYLPTSEIENIGQYHFEERTEDIGPFKLTQSGIGTANNPLILHNSYCTQCNKTLNVQVIWDDNDNLNKTRPQYGVYINLYKNNEEITGYRITDEDGWKYSFKYLDSNYEYNIDVLDNPKFYYYDISKSGDYWLVTFHYCPTCTFTIDAVKVWKDEGNRKNTRPEKVGIQLYDESGKIGEPKYISIPNYVTWWNLDNRKTYYIKELKVYNYHSKITKETELSLSSNDYLMYNITNTFTGEGWGNAEEDSEEDYRFYDEYGMYYCEDGVKYYNWYYNEDMSPDYNRPQRGDNCGSGKSSLSKKLPGTGFAPGVITKLKPLLKPYSLLTASVKFEIPTLGLSTEVFGVPNTNGDYDVAWLNKNVGWLQDTPFPGRFSAGNSVIVGHNYVANGTPGPFAHLEDLTYGDSIVISAFGEKYIYLVKSVEVVFADTPQVMSQNTDFSELTLITCKYFDEATGEYSGRIVIKASLQNVTEK